MKNYLKVTYVVNSSTVTQEFLTKEAHLITKVLKNQTNDKTCIVELMNVSEKEFKMIFG